MREDGPDRMRRAMLGAVAGGVAASALASRPVQAQSASGDDGLLEAFEALLDLSTREATLADNAIVIDSDAPFPLTRAEYADHLVFHRPLWEKREWHAYDVAAKHVGDTGVVTAYLMDRGKPKSAGFRIRPTYCTAVFSRTPAGWRAIGLHLGPLSGQLTDISPG
jgi:hypothetical protein